MDFFRQFILLLWKNWLLQSRKICVTVFEVLVPAIFAAIILATRTGGSVSGMTNTTVYNRSLVDGTVHDSFNDSSSGVSPNLPGTKAILYTPDMPIIRALMNAAIKKVKLDSNQLVEGKAFSNETELVKYFTNLNDTSTVMIGVVFEGDFDQGSSLSQSIRLKLRPKKQTNPWSTGQQFSDGEQTRPETKGPDYAGSSGFLPILYALTSAMIEMKNAAVNVTDNVTVYTEQIPYPPYFYDGFGGTFAIVGPLMTTLAMILSVVQLTKDIVYEKERKLKESMKMMGLSNFAHWAAWFFKAITVFTVVMAIILGFFCIPVTSEGRAIINESDKSLFFVFLLCYALSVIAFCFLVSACFSKANGAAAASAIFFVLCYSPYLALEGQYSSMTVSQKMASCLLFNVGLGYGFKIFAAADAIGKGVHWSELTEPATLDDNMPLLLVMVMLLVDTVLYLLATWYVDAVFPGEYGVPQPWYFPVTRTYWCGSKPKTNLCHVETDQYSTDQGCFEKDPEQMTPGISIRNLRKEFKSRGKEPKIAVNGTNLNVYEGQITALLGHNGAGKTTTMSMLTGFLPATSGTALVNGYDINVDIYSVRKSLGLCPQHDILFDTLTVKEHLIFFAILKGCPLGKVMKEARKMMKAVGLAGKENARSSTLSGGQKRKLSIAIALIAGSQVVILDEPTSGMDPQARRQIWSILQEHKANRTILFTTHFMDEADVLGDRVAIMAEGVVKCCGSPLYLKKRYGSGYELTIVKASRCDIQTITRLVKYHVTSATKKSDVGAELTYCLPSTESPNFEHLFKDLESQSGALGISSFGASVTTMEEVFLRVGEDDPSTRLNVNTNGVPLLRSSTEMLNGDSAQSIDFLAIDQNEAKNTGLSLMAQQFRAALTKKMLYSWRNPIVTIAQIILPIVFTILGLVAGASFQAVHENDPPLTLSMMPFEENVVAYQNSYPDQTWDAPGASPIALFLSQLAGTASQPKNVTQMVSFYEEMGLELPVPVYNKRYLIGAAFEDGPMGQSGTPLQVTGYYNGQGYHTEAIVFALMMNTLLKYFDGPETNITVVNHPLPDASSKRSATSSATGFNVGFFIVFGMAFMASCYVIFLIKERVTQAKQIQLVSGLGPISFWLTHWIWDYIMFLVPCAGIIAVFAAFQNEVFSGNTLGYLFVILLVFGWAVLPYTYALSFLFRTPPGGVVGLVTVNFLVGFLLMTVLFVVSSQPTTASDVLRWTFGSLLPIFCVGQSVKDFYDNHEFLKLCTGIESHCYGQKDHFSMSQPAVGRYVVLMGSQGVFYFILVMLIEYGIIRKLLNVFRSLPEYPPDIRRATEDEDVAAERTRINSSHPKRQTDSLILHNLSKFYGNHLAVNKLCLGVPKNECFGLLGVNGAGKTSTFKMLTGEENVSDGNAYINGYGVRERMQKVQQNIGYCPQFDALIDQMTGRETLTMYARLRGIPEIRIPDIVNQLMNTLWFDEHADKETQYYSGGTKRKLSTAVALIGDSPVIFLDEPTTGVDPVARRQLWNLLSRIRASGRTLILTSHSMEECDALCTRLAIMVNGQFLCLGSPQHLKNKFGQGYTFIARVESSYTQALEHFIEHKFPSHRKMDSSTGYVSYQLTDPNLPLSYIFGTVENSQQQLHLEDYSISQTTLHQVFLDFTKHQIVAETRTKKKCCCACCCCCCRSK